MRFSPLFLGISATVAKEFSLDGVTMDVPEFKLIDLMDGERTPEHLASTNPPVVVMHGMGDSGSNSGMKSICKRIAVMHNTYVKCLDVADSLSSITTKADEQLAEMARVIQGDAKIMASKTINTMGISQGGLFVRAYAERVNIPQVKKIVSLTGTQNGISTCPTALSWACPIFERVADPYNLPWIFSDYWKESNNIDQYLRESRFLADINNERATKNTTYAANMKNLDLYVLIEATHDSMVIPHASETHGFYKWGTKEVEVLRDTQAFKEDWLGLRTLDEAGKIKEFSYPGEHVQIPHDMLNNQILPLLGGDSSTAGTGGVKVEQMEQNEVYA